MKLTKEIPTAQIEPKDRLSQKSKEDMVHTNHREKIEEGCED